MIHGVHHTCEEADKEHRHPPEDGSRVRNLQVLPDLGADLGPERATERWDQLAEGGPLVVLEPQPPVDGPASPPQLRITPLHVAIHELRAPSEEHATSGVEHAHRHECFQEQAHTQVVIDSTAGQSSHQDVAEHDGYAAETEFKTSAAQMLQLEVEVLHMYSLTQMCVLYVSLTSENRFRQSVRP